VRAEAAFAQQPFGELAADHAGGAENQNVQDPSPFFKPCYPTRASSVHSFTAPVMADT
jgi:hypothetical protein